MFTPKGYYLTKELAEIGDINISNFSNFIAEDKDNHDIVKYGACTFINSKGDIPQNFKDLINQHKFTDLENMVLYSELGRVLEVQMKYILEALKDFNPKEVYVCKKRFIEFNPSFRELLYNKTIYTLTPEETEECLDDGSIMGFIKLTKKCNMVWYNVY